MRIFSKNDFSDRLLEAKFGPLDPEILAHINRLDSKALLKYSERFVTAQTLSDVIGH